MLLLSMLIAMGAATPEPQPAAAQAGRPAERHASLILAGRAIARSDDPDRSMQAGLFPARPLPCAGNGAAALCAPSKPAVAPAVAIAEAASRGAVPRWRPARYVTRAARCDGVPHRSL